ncbi:rod-determining factor RdfA [Halorientalis regularis]|uniref:Uncharacterized protein n=1 Tax=Halorientalis regularis TaxID=660518 RepID=A0A1G7KCL7_9EURY|nr:rod-determining factor RdfA [Halorientalis regularis]SDF34866.1 hypothetical protein SAMN05216218_105254 [Halorientalis regularis]
MTTDASCKVDRVIETYGLTSADPVFDSIDEGLLSRWTGAGERSAVGYRSLTEWFNKRLLKTVYDDHGRDTLGATVDSDYEVLQSDDELVVAELAESLRADGIDADDLRGALVSWGTMRTHLQDCLDGQKEPQTATTDWEVESVRKAIGVTESKVESALSALAQKERLAGGGTADIEVQVQLGCDACPTRVPFDVALERGYVCETHHAQPLSRDAR